MGWRQLMLWPRLAIGVTVGFLVLFAGFSVLGIRAVDASTNRILHERLAITEELAEDVDGVLEHRLAGLAAFDARPATPATRHRLLAEIDRASGGAFTSVALLDRRGTVVDAVGAAAPRLGTSLAGERYVAQALAAGRRVISPPFRDARGTPVVALAVPVTGGGQRHVLVGTLDLTGKDMVKRLGSAQRLGRGGHAELVGPGGIELASTETTTTLVPGEHLAFYRRMLKASAPGIADVPVTGSGGSDEQKHVMAFVRLSVAPWGVALGDTAGETYAPAHRLRRTLLLAGGGALAALWLITLLGARLLVRPVRTLTAAAEEMASGNLDEPVEVPEGGEIGVLAASLETMRVQLKDLLETVRRWGEELELKVGERTAELNARNRQLAAVGAILAAANETLALEDMLRRCLDVVLAQTSVDGAAVRLGGDGHDEPVSVVVSPGWDEFPCRSCPSDACARASEPGQPPVCAGPQGLTVLPLRAPIGVLGALSVGRRDGTPPDEDELPILTAICDQVAVAVENARLASELRRLEAQDEVQRMRSELISAVSHELRTPLGFIKGYATTLLREDAPIDDATRRSFLEIIDEETGRLEHMIEELLDASRLQAGRLPITPEPVALDELVVHAVAKARPALEGAGHVVGCRVPPDPVSLLADPLRIGQVLDNLLENASRYADPGSPIDVSVHVEDGHAVLGVANLGAPLARTELERIFEPFYRGPRAAGRGAGLGLSISRGIVEAHGGRIWAESGDGRTTTFLVTLPLAR